MSNPLTLDDFNKRILEPAIQAFEKKTGKTRQQLIAEYDKGLEPHRRVMKWAREMALKNGSAD